MGNFIDAVATTSQRLVLASVALIGRNEAQRAVEVLDVILNFVPVPGHWGTLPLSVKGAPNGTTATEVHRRL